MSQLFKISIAEPDKWAEANCAHTIFPDLFFPTTLEEVEASEPMIEQICSTCPLRQECLRLALDNKDFNGYFGGVSPDDRRKMSAHRSRVKRGNSLEVERLTGLGYTLQDACDEVGILLASYYKWKNQGKNNTTDKDKK